MAKNRAGIHVRLFFLISISLALGSSVFAAEPESVLVPVMGPSKLVFDSNPAYINDHTVFKGPAGQWHMLGITHKKVAGGKLPVPWAEEEFAHAYAPSLEGPWQALPPVLRIDLRLGENHVWAPHVVHHNGRFYCFYAGGGGHFTSMINLATSADLKVFSRHPANPLFRDCYDARDPMVLKVGDEWVMYYTKTYSITERMSTVAYRKSKDLVHWGEPGFAFIDRTLHTDFPNSGHTESPFVLHYRGYYYLFVCTPDLNYKCTRVYVSRDPLHFDEKNEVATLIAHCPEVVEDGDKLHLTHAGWFDDGLYLAPLEMVPAGRFYPALAFADSGENNDHLISAVKARTVKRGLVKALKLGEGGSLEYELPAPRQAKRISLVFEEWGATRATAGGVTVLDEKAADRGERELHVIELDEPGQWKDGKLRVRFEPANRDDKSAPEVYYVKVYYR